MNKGALAFLRRSIVAKDTAPEKMGVLHYIRPRQAASWAGFSDEDITYWGGTIGNTILSSLERRPKGANTCSGFKDSLLPTAIRAEFVTELEDIEVWDSEAVIRMGEILSEVAADVWY